MGRRESILERVSKSIDLNTEPYPGLPLAEISGENRVLIENHRGVVKYSCCEILAKVRFGYFCVQGNGLKLLQMTKERLVIGGCIDSVHLVRRG